MSNPQTYHKTQFAAADKDANGSGNAATTETPIEATKPSVEAKEDQTVSAKDPRETTAFPKGTLAGDWLIEPYGEGIRASHQAHVFIGTRENFNKAFRGQ